MPSSENKSGDELSKMNPGASDDVFLYYGESMKGTFHLWDHLIAAPVSLDDLRPGDVLIYCEPSDQGDSSHQVVHRVVAFTSAGAITRGDSSSANDTDPVMAHNIIGRVTHVERDGKIYPVYGGIRGIIWGRLLNLRYTFPRGITRFFWQKIAPLPFFRYPYRWLRQSGLVPRIWHPVIVKVYLETEEGPVTKFVVGNRTVARWCPQTNQFWCRRPYDLIISKPE
jgi:signal peptidase I